jgi:hypothetical protein
MTESRTKRYDDCFALEMTFNGDCFYGIHNYNKDFNVHWTEVACDDDRTWEQKVAYMKNELLKRKVDIDEKEA